jgi:hypothetical protein
MKTGFFRNLLDELRHPIRVSEPFVSEPPKVERVRFSLQSILGGDIRYTFEAGGRKANLCLDFLSDSLVLFVQFVREIAEGRSVSGNMGNYRTSAAAVSEGPEPHLCRLRFHASGAEDTWNNGAHDFDLIVERDQVIQELRDFLGAIADYPHFAHHYECYLELDDEICDRVGDEADREWEEGVKNGTYPDDLYARFLFEESKIAENVPLPEGGEEDAERTRVMLRTLEIPEAWLKDAEYRRDTFPPY